MALLMEPGVYHIIYCAGIKISKGDNSYRNYIELSPLFLGQVAHWLATVNGFLDMTIFGLSQKTKLSSISKNKVENYIVLMSYHSYLTLFRRNIL